MCITNLIQNKIKELSGNNILNGSLDITFHRDDYRERLVIPKVENTEIPFSINGKIVILIDDVLYTGRTVRAALDELNSFGRAAKIQLAVLVDRGHRELPIKADFVGKNIPWVHFDIAGTAWGAKPSSINPKGSATGVAIRLVLDMLER